MLIIGIIIALIVGVGVGYVVRQSVAKTQAANAEARVEKLLNDAKAKEQDILTKAKEQSLRIIEDAKADEKQRRSELSKAQQRVEKRENMFDKQVVELEQKRENLEKKITDVKAKAEQIKDLRAKAANQLEAVSGLSKEQALEQLMQRVQADSEEALVSRLRKLEQKSEEELEKKSRQILSLALTRYASSQCAESTTTHVQLPSDEMKGRIIGKEGRNIKALELLTGCEIIVDETPQSIMISGFSPIRRQVAKRAIDSLVRDGRIHPARIEEAIKEAKKELALEMKKAGEEALTQLGIPVGSIDPKLVSILGRLKFRTSYGQNVLQHSIEVGTLAGMMAAELGADVFNCKKGGLFHDIGKAVDHDMQGAHPEIGYNIMKKFGWPEELCYQSIAHHEDRPRTIEGAIVKAADALSGSRPGARKNSLEQFIARMEALENTATSFPGVEKAYAIQAGREVRVFIEPQQVDDFGAYKLAKEIAAQIESELTYPGEIKVTIIRETRVIEFAR